MDDGVLLIDITYQLRATNDIRNLVYPFYVIPGGAGVSRIPDVTLDDRGFQDLVNEARLRLSQRCPEWSEHNVSDPGITLVELFSWLTEAIIYRLNRVPEKLHVTLLNLLGIELAPPGRRDDQPAFPACSAPSPDPVAIAAGVTEVGHGAHGQRGGDRLPDDPRTSSSRPRGRSPTRSSAAAR